MENCNKCGSSKYEIAYSFNLYNGNIREWICLECGHGYTIKDMISPNGNN